MNPHPSRHPVAWSLAANLAAFLVLIVARAFSGYTWYPSTELWWSLLIWSPILFFLPMIIWSTFDQKTLVFLTRSLRQESRLWSHHLLRGLLGLLVMIIALGWVLTGFSVGAPGIQFFDQIITSSYWFLTVCGGIYFAAAVAEEKEEQTLPLLRMTGITDLSFLVGKTVPRLVTVCLFGAVTAPFAILAVTLGGVLTEQIGVACLGFLAYAFFLSQLGIFCSVVRRSVATAFSLYCVLWILFEISGWFFDFFVVPLRQNGWDRLADAASALYQAQLEVSMFVTSDNLLIPSFGPAQFWTPQVAFHTYVGLLLFIASWLLFEPCARNAIAASENQASLTKKLLGPGSRVSGRSWSHALQWKTWQQVTGGWPWFIAKLLIYPIITGVIVILLVVLGAFSSSSTPKEIIGGFGGALMGSGLIGLLVELMRSLGRVFNDEMRARTVSSLLMLPRSAARTMWSMIAGLIPGVMPSIFWGFFGGTVLLSVNLDEFSSGEVEDFITFWFYPWTWAVILYVVLGLHLGVYLSLMLRYGGMVLAVVAMVFSFCMCQSVVGMLAMLFMGPSARGSEDFLIYVVPVLLIACEIALCIVLQLACCARFQAIATKA